MEATTPKGYEKEMPHPADFFDAHRRHWEDRATVNLVIEDNP